MPAAQTGVLRHQGQLGQVMKLGDVALRPSPALSLSPTGVRYRCGSLSEISILKRLRVATEHTLAHFEAGDIERAGEAFTSNRSKSRLGCWIPLAGISTTFGSLGTN